MGMALDFDRVEWVASTPEEPVDPRRRIVDAHVHLWDGRFRRHLVEDVRAEAAGHHVTDVVFVECMWRYRPDGPEELRPVGETEAVAALAARADGGGESGGPRIGAIVGHADLGLGDRLEDVLDAHVAAGGGRLRGIRQSAAWDADPAVPDHPGVPRGLLAEPRVRRGVALLGRRGLSFDSWAYHTQLGEVADLARAAEATTIVVDHLGGPLKAASYGGRGDVDEAWRAGMTRLAGCPNVVVKLGGVGMDFVHGTEWSQRPRPPGSDEVVARFGDAIAWCIDTFGPSRCLFESNYPVDRQSLGYTVIWNAFQKIAARYGEAEQDELFAGTAARVYRISGEPAP
jgi:predicted TIM-barrel fold metal-dependent hydrolase